MFFPLGVRACVCNFVGCLVLSWPCPGLVLSGLVLILSLPCLLPHGSGGRAGGRHESIRTAVLYAATSSFSRPPPQPHRRVRFVWFTTWQLAEPKNNTRRSVFLGEGRPRTERRGGGTVFRQTCSRHPWEQKNTSVSQYLRILLYLRLRAAVMTDACFWAGVSAYTFVTYFHTYVLDVCVGDFFVCGRSDSCFCGVCCREL